MKNRVLQLFVGGVVVSAAAALAVLPFEGLGRDPLLLAVLVGMAAAAGLRPIRFSSRGHTLTATHPVVLCALAGLGAYPALLTALGGLAAALAVSPRSRRPHRALFNVGDVVLSTAAAWGTFTLMGGRSGEGTGAVLVPLLGAAAAYYLVNTGLIAVAVSLERGRRMLRGWTDAFSWTAPSYLTGLTVAVAMLTGLEHLGPIGLGLALPPIWLISGFYREHRARLKEKQRRVDTVERLNDELRGTVGELSAALDHVKRLQGLLPICMHCKKVRDDRDSWQRIESYLALHSELRFTHSLCEGCRDEHYPSVRPREPESV